MAVTSGGSPRRFVTTYLWLVLTVVGGIGFLAVYLLMPHKSEIDSPLQVVAKLGVFLLIAGGIAWFPNTFRARYLMLLLPLSGFLGYVIPRLSYLGFIAVPQGRPNADGEFYTYLYLILYPAILLSVILAYRIGGGSPGTCLKLALAGVILIFSGFLDVLWFLVNPTGLPQTLEHAHHIEMILGHYPSYLEAVVFTLLHLPLLVVVLLLPLDAWVRRWLGEPAVPVSAREP